jgi:Tfp pilus assembly major pilin PilA
VTAGIIGLVVYVFARSAAIAHLKGSGVEVSAAQFSDLYGQFTQCCQKLSIGKQPGIYILNGNGVLNAYATWFLGRRYVVLLSNVVDAMEENPNGARFYIGHELAHVARHDNWVLSVLRWPALRLPLLGAAFSRARESTCDLNGLACSESREGAARSLLALAAGATRWKKASLEATRQQLAPTGGFWMSFHELTASYPWTIKRVVRTLDENPEIPRRNPFAYLLALFVPYAGRVPAGFGAILYFYFIAVLAAIAIPAYQNYTIRATLAAAVTNSQPVRDALGAYYVANQKIPTSFEAAGVDAAGAKGLELTLSPKGMVLTVKAARGTLIFVPAKDSQGNVVWRCTGGPGVQPAQLPPSCK